eukprot:scaffold285_cov330-Pavlova_lutheri.AAC.114
MHPFAILRMSAYSGPRAPSCQLVVTSSVNLFHPIHPQRLPQSIVGATSGRSSLIERPPCRTCRSGKTPRWGRPNHWNRTYTLDWGRTPYHWIDAGQSFPTTDVT